MHQGREVGVPQFDAEAPAAADGGSVLGQHAVGAVDDHEDRDRKLPLGDDGELGQAHLQRSVSDDGEDGVPGGDRHADGHREGGPHGQVAGEGVVAGGGDREVLDQPEPGLRHVEGHQRRCAGRLPERVDEFHLEAAPTACPGIDLGPDGGHVGPRRAGAEPAGQPVGRGRGVGVDLL